MEKPHGMPFSETYKIYVSVIEEEFRTYDCKTNDADMTHARGRYVYSKKYGIRISRIKLKTQFQFDYTFEFHYLCCQLRK